MKTTEAKKLQIKRSVETRQNNSFCYQSLAKERFFNVFPHNRQHRPLYQMLDVALIGVTSAN